MGWLYIYRPAGLTTEEIIRRECLSFAHVPENMRPEIVGTAQGAGCMAFAVRLPAAYVTANPSFADLYEPAPDGSVTTAELVLYSCPAGQIGFKGMSETSGPFETVGASFLKLLSPIRPCGGDRAQWARDWRAKCQATADAKAAARRKAARITPGTRLRFANPIHFRSGAAFSEFVAVSHRKWSRGREVDSIAFRAIGDGSLCQLPPRLLASAELVEG